MRNWRELSDTEIQELQRLYPTTPNRELARKFDISVDGLKVGFVIPGGWKKDKNLCLVRYNKLTDKQTQWIIKHYKHTKNGDILVKFNIGESCLRRVANKYGLKKTPQFISKMRKESCAVSKDVARTYGVYDDNAKVLERYREECRAKGLSIGFKKGECNKTRFSSERFSEIMKKVRESRNETIRKDRVRIHWGLPQKTKMKLTGGGHKRAAHRYIFRSHGYLVAKGSNIVYYDKETNRSEKMEQNAHRYGLTVCAYQ